MCHSDPPNQHISLSDFRVVSGGMVQFAPTGFLSSFVLLRSIQPTKTTIHLQFFYSIIQQVSVECLSCDKVAGIPPSQNESFIE